MENIENKKKLANILKRAKNTAKPEKCIMCGKPQTSYCNSHLISQMVLKTIADNGKLLHPNALMGIEILDIEKGINNAGTFHFICRKCDSELFQDYENPDKMKTYPTDIMMAEIALKNMLLMLSKRNEEKEIFNIIQNEMNGFENKKVLNEIQGLDTQEYLDDLDLYKQIIENNSKGCFQILYWNKLPFIVPLAAQSPVAVYKDMYGDIINDVYDTNPNCHMQNLHLCVFPIALAFFMQQLVKTGCCFHLEKKGAVNIEENQKLYKHIPVSLISSRSASSCRRCVFFSGGASKRNWSTDI